MTTKTNLATPAYNSTSWDTPLNSNFDILNDAIGATQAVSITTLDVTLTASQAQHMRIALSGALTGNRTLFLPSGTSGSWIITNGTTGSYTISVQNVAGSNSIDIAQGYSSLVYSDGSTVGFGDSYIAPGSVGTTSLADDAVTTAKIADSNVTTAKIADSNVTTAKIADLNVTTAKLAAANVTAAKLDGAQSGSSPIFGVRAWVKFTVSGSTPTIAESGNVASVTRSSTGLYVITFSTPHSTADYGAYGNAATTTGLGVNFSSQTTSTIRMNIWTAGTNATLTDPSYAFAMFIW